MIENNRFGWLNATFKTDYLSDAKFFDISKAHRQAALSWLVSEPNAKRRGAAK